MKFIHFPRIYVPDNLVLPTEQELESQTRPLNFCSTCNYVLCSCGNCHNSLLCNEPCTYDAPTQENEQS